MYLLLQKIAAARGGHLDLIQWLCEKYYPKAVVSYVGHNAALCNHQHILDWLLENPALRKQELGEIDR